MTYIDKSDMHALGTDTAGASQVSKDKAEPAKKKSKNPYEK